MTTKQLAQGSAEWLLERSERLTGSRFAAAAGICKYTSRQKLYREYMGLEPNFDGNDATDWGTEHEKDAIFELECETGLIVQATGLHVHPDYNWLACSPDGLIESGMVEVKCPYFSESPHQKVPINYMAQIQGSMEILDVDYCLFGSWRPDDFSLFRVDRSKEYWDWLFPRLEDFWNSYLNMEQPKKRKKEYFEGEIKIERLK